MAGLAKEKQELYTVDHIFALPDGERAELIDGVLYDMAPPARGHQRLLLELATVINNYIESHGGDCEVDIAPFAVFLDDSNMNYVEPDISVICDKSKLDDEGCHGAPDWVIEVVSPSSVRMDYIIKLYKYEEVGVRFYWIVDLQREIVRVYDFEHEDTMDYTFEEETPSGLYEDLLIKVGELLG